MKHLKEKKQAFTLLEVCVALFVVGISLKLLSASIAGTRNLQHLSGNGETRSNQPFSDWQIFKIQFQRQLDCHQFKALKTESSGINMLYLIDAQGKEITCHMSKEGKDKLIFGSDKGLGSSTIFNGVWHLKLSYHESSSIFTVSATVLGYGPAKAKFHLQKYTSPIPPEKKEKRNEESTAKEKETSTR